MQNQTILYGIIGLLAGSLLTVAVTSNAVNNQNYGMMRMMGIRQQAASCPMEEAKANGMMGIGSSMEEMMESITEKTDDDFDKAFIEAMIVHHQGAIDMANEAKTAAKHQEIKDLADDIINAQTSEIEMMKSWQQTWGY